MRQFILGTDWWTDCDDAVAVRLLARAALRGECRLLGAVINAAMEYSVPSLDGFLSEEGLCGVPIGIDPAATDFGGRPPYQRRLAPYARAYPDNAAAEYAVSLYRRLLAEATEPVELIEIGYLSAFAALLESKGDCYSPLDGVSLVRERVNHVWIMAGKWDEENGKENNFARNPRARAAADVTCRLCPTPITFLGYEVGFGVLSGGELAAGDLLRQALADHGSDGGRHSWDPMLVLLALTGDALMAGYGTVRGVAAVDPQTGENRFREDPRGPHRYVRRLCDAAYYASAINALIRSPLSPL